MSMRAKLLATLVVVPQFVMAGPTFEVGGIGVTMSDEGWELSDAKGPPGLMGHGGIDATVPSEGKLLVRRDRNGNVLAAVLVSASRGMPRSVTLRGSCPDRKSEPTVYEYKHGNPGGGPRTCAAVGGPFISDGTLKNFPYLFKAQAAHGFAVPEAAYYFRGYAFDQNGAMFSVDGLAVPEFTGLVGIKPSTEPGEGVKPEIAAWGDAFGNAIKRAHDGVFSRSTTLPPFKFTGSPEPR